MLANGLVFREDGVDDVELHRVQDEQRVLSRATLSQNAGVERVSDLVSLVCQRRRRSSPLFSREEKGALNAPNEKEEVGSGGELKSASLKQNGKAVPPFSPVSFICTVCL